MKKPLKSLDADDDDIFYLIRSRIPLCQVPDTRIHLFFKLFSYFPYTKTKRSYHGRKLLVVSAADRFLYTVGGRYSASFTLRLKKVLSAYADNIHKLKRRERQRRSSSNGEKQDFYGGKVGIGYEKRYGLSIGFAVLLTEEYL